LAKTLVCIQAIWFCIQCIVRLSQKLTISLLELNTFAHALCTLVVFGLWWDKPLYIDQPSLLRGQDVEEITTFLLVLSGCNEKFASATQQEQQFFQIWKDFPKKPTASTTDFGHIETIPNTRASFIYTFSTIRQIIKERDEWAKQWSEKQEELKQRSITEEHCLKTAIGVAMKTATKNLSQKPLLHLRISNGAHQSTGEKGLIQDFGGFLFAGVCYGGLHLTA